MLAFLIPARLNPAMAEDATPANDGSDDCLKPPDIPIEVHCLHCGEEYQSYLMEYRIEPRRRGRPMGFWCCPTPGCDGAGFLFDIVPTDPDWRDENGERVWSSDDGEENEFGCGKGEFSSDFSDDPDDNWLPLAEEDDDTEWNEDFYQAMDAEEKRAREERAARHDGTTAEYTRPDAFDDFNEDDIPF